jgi:hypothetical protein
MQRLTSGYRTSLILAAANAGASGAPAADAAPEPRGYGPERRSGYRDEYRDLEDFDTGPRDVDYRDLSATDYDDQPTYWYWSYDHPDAGI